MRRTLSALLLLLASIQASACQISSSGRTFSNPERYAENHQLIFIGKVLSINNIDDDGISGSNDQIGKFEVIEVLAGEHKEKNIRVKNIRFVCTGYFTNKGSYYVVMANQNLSGEYETEGILFGLRGDKLTAFESEKIDLIRSSVSSKGDR